MPTVTINKKLFEANSEITSPSMFTLANNSSSTFATADYLSEPNPSLPGQFINYKFLFWNIQSQIYTSDSTTIANVGTNNFTATAWYLRTGGGEGRPRVRTSAFSIGFNEFLLDTPIASAVPATEWPSSTSKIVYTDNADVEIDAVNSFGTESYDHWLVLFGSATTSGDDLSAEQNASPFTVVFYNEPSSSIGPVIEPGLIEVIDIFDRYRKYLGDFVSDPAPMDLARVMGKWNQKINAAGQVDELSLLTKDVQSMDKNELANAKDGLEAKVNRLRTAIKMVDTTMKNKTSK